MPQKYTISITTTCNDHQHAAEVSNLLKGAFEKVAQADLLKLLKAVNQNPGIVKTALKFL